MLQSYRENDQVYERAIVGMVEEWAVLPTSLSLRWSSNLDWWANLQDSVVRIRFFAAKAPGFLPGRDEQAVKYSPTVPALAIVT